MKQNKHSVVYINLCRASLKNEYEKGVIFLLDDFMEKFSKITSEYNKSLLKLNKNIFNEEKK